MLRMLTLGSGMLRLCTGLLAPSSGKSGRCSRPETKTEPAKEKVEYDYTGTRQYFRSVGIATPLYLIGLLSILAINAHSPRYFQGPSSTDKTIW